MGPTGEAARAQRRGWGATLAFRHAGAAAAQPQAQARLQLPALVSAPRAKRALHFSGNEAVDAAVNWLMARAELGARGEGWDNGRHAVQCPACGTGGV